MHRLVIEGNRVYVIDEECLKKKQENMKLKKDKLNLGKNMNIGRKNPGRK